MARRASGWALLASVGIHLAAVCLPLFAWQRGSASPNNRNDFWAGDTFEPSQVADPGASVLGGEDRAIEVEADWSAPSSTGEPIPLADPVDPSAPEAAPGRPAASKVARVARARTAGGAPSRAGANAEANGERAGGGTFGGEGAAPGTRDLVRSFVRALPTVASSDAVWAALPLGSAGSADVALEIDAEQKPRLTDLAPAAAPAHLRRLIHKTVVVLSGGRFAPTDLASSGPSRLRVAVTLTQLRAPSDSERAAGGVFGLGFEGADAHHVSRAFFTLASGRHVEVTVKALGR